MSREVQVRFCESRGVRFPPATHLVILVSGTREHAKALLPEAAEVLSTVGLRLSEEKTLITHIDEGLDFLGWHIQRHQKRGTDRQYVYNYPAKKALRSIKAKTKAICRMNVSLPLAVLLHKLNQVLRGWTAYFRPGVSARALHLRMIVWRQVFGWLRRKHPNAGWKELRRRFCDGKWWPRDGEVVLFNPGLGGHHALPAPRDEDPIAMAQQLRKTTAQRDLRRAGCGANPHVRFGRAARRNGPGEIPEPRSVPTPPRC